MSPRHRGRYHSTSLKPSFPENWLYPFRWTLKVRPSHERQIRRGREWPQKGTRSTKEVLIAFVLLVPYCGHSKLRVRLLCYSDAPNFRDSSADHRERDFRDGRNGGGLFPQTATTAICERRQSRRSNGSGSCNPPRSISSNDANRHHADRDSVRGCR